MFYKILLLLLGLILLILNDQMAIRRLSKAVLSSFIRRTPQLNTLTNDSVQQEVVTAEVQIPPFESRTDTDDPEILRQSEQWTRQIFALAQSMPQSSEIHLNLQTNAQANWWEALVTCHFLINCLDNPQITRFKQEISASEVHPIQFLYSLIQSAVLAKSIGQSLEFAPVQTLEDMPNLPFRSAIYGYLFSQNWEQSAILINLSDYAIQIDLTDIFIKDFYVEQINLIPSKIGLRDLDREQFKIQLGKRTGELTLPPYSFNKLSSQFFIPQSLPINQIDIGLRIEPHPEDKYLNIHYQLSQNIRLNLLIFNAWGQIKFRLERQRQKPGKYDIQLNTKNLPSGVYQVVLISRVHLWQQSVHWKH